MPAALAGPQRRHLARPPPARPPTCSAARPAVPSPMSASSHCTTGMTGSEEPMAKTSLAALASARGSGRCSRRLTPSIPAAMACRGARGETQKHYREHSGQRVKRRGLQVSSGQGAGAGCARRSGGTQPTSGSSCIMRCTVMPSRACSKGGTTTVPSACGSRCRAGWPVGSVAGGLQQRQQQQGDQRACCTPCIRQPKQGATKQPQAAGLTSTTAMFMLGPSATWPWASTKMPCNPGGRGAQRRSWG